MIAYWTFIVGLALGGTIVHTIGVWRDTAPGKSKHPAGVLDLTAFRREQQRKARKRR